jgi:hypothetical protein
MDKQLLDKLAEIYRTIDTVERVRQECNVVSNPDGADAFYDERQKLQEEKWQIIKQLVSGNHGKK